MSEKGLKDISRPLREQYEKGRVAIQRENLDYAIQILTHLLHQEPAFYECREALRAAQVMRARKKGGLLKKIFGTAGGSSLLAKAQVQLRTNPQEAIHTAELVLNQDPNSLTAHRTLAEAALAVGLPRTAVLSLEIVFKNAPDRETAMKLGQAFAAAGQAQRAESVLSDLANAFPGDLAVHQALKDACAKRSLSEGYEQLEGGGGSYRDVLRNKAEAVALEQEKREVKSEDLAARLLDEYEARLEREPQNLRLMRSIAELLTEKHQFDRALAYYRRIIATEGVAEPSLEQAIINTTLRQYNHALAALDPEAPDHAETRERLSRERQAYEVGEWQRLADRNPTDLQIWFELGKVLLQAGQVREAIKAFQKAQNNPHLRPRALQLLAECFARQGIYDLAARSLQNALRDKPVFDEHKKELVYALAEIYEKMGKTPEAIEQLKLIYEVDIGYRDVAEKIDAHYARK